MNVLFFSTYSLPYISGMTKYADHVIKYFEKRGAHVSHLFFYPRLYNSEKRISIPYFTQLYKGFLSFHAPKLFWEKIKENDVVLVNYPNIEVLPLIVCAVLQKKKIVTIFHCSVILPSGFLNLIIGPFLFASLIIHLCASATVIAQEDYILSQWWSIFFKKKCVFVDPPIVLPKDAFPIKKIINSVGFIGRISSEKGIEYLIEAVHMLKNMTLYFIGPTQVEGEQSYRRAILNLLIEKKVRYHFISNPSDKELADHVSQLEMIVVPSINQTEAYGMVQPESMCRGVAVIATDLPGIRIPIKKTQMGLLVPPKNPEALAHAIQKIHDDLSHYVNPENVQNARMQFKPTKSLEIIYNTLAR